MLRPRRLVALVPASLLVRLAAPRGGAVDAATAESLVSVRVVVTTTEGEPVSGVPFTATSRGDDGTSFFGRFKTGAEGVGVFEAIPHSVAEVAMTTDGGVSSSGYGVQRSVGGHLVLDEAP